MPKPAIRKLLDSHPPGGSAAEIQGSPDVFCNGLPVHRKFDRDLMGCIQMEVSSSTFANGLGRARFGDKNSCMVPTGPGSGNTMID